MLINFLAVSAGAYSNKWTLMSVYFVQECTMIISACVVDEFGMAPYWLSPIFLSIAGFKCSSTTNFLSIAGFKCSSTTNSSATFDRTGVNEWDIGAC